MSEFEHNGKQVPTMKAAGIMVGLDLERPIDCSEMNIAEVSEDHYIQEQITREIIVERKAVLFAYVYNEYGEREDLTIEFTLKSRRRAKF